MNKDNRTDTVFLPIKPQYAQAILRGEKRVEFRKKFPINVKRVIIYSSSPEKKILGWFDVDKVDVLHPKKAWELYNAVGSIEKEDFFVYYADKDTASVIKIKNVNEFNSYVPTTKELEITIPQSFFYVQDSLWSELQKYTDIDNLTRWEYKPLGEIAEFIGGGTPSKNNPQFWNGDIPWASIKDVKGDYLYSTVDSITDLGLNESSTNIAFPNEIILGTRINPGRPIISTIRTAINQDLKVVKPLITIDTKFLFFAFKQLEKNIVKLSSGTTVLGISLNNLKQVSLPIPPLPEQRAIVSKIEQLFSELDNGIANLKTAQEQLKIYRQAVLKKAFEGEFTKEWREQQTELPTADELLKQIKAEREALYDNQVAEWKEAVKTWDAGGKEGKKPAKPKKAKELPELRGEELDALPVLPSNWQWKTLDNIANIISGFAFKSKDFIAKGIPVTKIANVSYNEYLTKDQQFLPTEFLKIASDYIIVQNDILIALTRPITQNKVKVCRYLLDSPSLLNQRVAMFKNIGVLDKYLSYYLQSDVFKKHIKTKFSETLQPNLSPVDLKKSPFPICSTVEQNQIVLEIDSRLSVCDKVEETIKTSLQQSESLRQSILKKAFEGKLLTSAELEKCQNESDWEPAGELLKRLKEETKASLKKTNSTKRTKKKDIKMELKSVIDVLQEASEPLEAKEVWQLSVFKDDIEAFYAELKKIEDQIEEIKDGSSSKLSLK